MQTPLAQIIRWQELSHGFGGWNFHHVLRVRQKRSIHGEGHRHAHALVFGNAISEQYVLERFLRRRYPCEQPSHVAHRHGVVVLDSKCARIVESAVTDKEQHRHAVRRSHDQCLEAVAPSGSTRACECAGIHGTGMFHNFELRMLAVGDDVLGIQLAIGNDFGEGVHNLCIWTNRISSDDVDVCQTHRLSDGLAACQQIFAFVDICCFGFFSNH